MQLNDILLIIVGAALGAIMRYIIVSQRLFIGSLPIGVLLVNFIGCIILGAFMIIVQLYNLDNRYILFVAIGFTGSLTTMSSFAFETVNIIESKQLQIALLNIALNIGLSISGIFIGRIIVSLILRAW